MGKPAAGLTNTSIYKEKAPDASGAFSLFIFLINS